MVDVLLARWCGPGVIDHLRHHKGHMGAAPQTRVHGSHHSESVNDILCMHLSHMYYNRPGNETIGIAVNILKNWRCLLPVY